MYRATREYFIRVITARNKVSSSGHQSAKRSEPRLDRLGWTAEQVIKSIVRVQKEGEVGLQSM